MKKKTKVAPWSLGLIAIILFFGACLKGNNSVPVASAIEKTAGQAKHHDNGSEAALPAPESATASADSCLRFAMPVTPKGVPEQVLFNDAYVSSFDSITLMPNWVAWRLTGSHTKGEAKRSDAAFTPDDRVASRHRVTTFDYQRSGYDRGHMCPAADNKWSAEAMRQCFLMTNICPQNHNLNVGDWNEMENQCRKWAEEYGEVYVVCGPILYKGTHKRIGSDHKVTVPEAFFKVVLCVKDKPWVACFIYKNESGDRPKGDYQNTLSEVERITGLKFFPKMDKAMRKSLQEKRL